MKLPVGRVIGILNGFFNPLLLCAFLPIIEGAPGLDLTSPTGFLDNSSWPRRSPRF